MPYADVPVSVYTTSLIADPTPRTKIVVENGWADYVFDEGYQLKPLREVADYVHVNHHLPDVPTAADIKKTGVNVGETETMLLKKIEELTLYLIEKDKQLQLQEERLKVVEQQLKTTKNNK